MQPIALLIAAAILVWTPAALGQQDSDRYFGFALSSIRYSETGAGAASPMAFGILAGHQISRSFALEGRGGIGIIEDSFPMSGLRVRIDHYLAMYAKGSLQISPRWSVFGLLGVAGAKFSARNDLVFLASSGGGLASGSATSRSDTGASYGAGLAWQYDADIAVRFEWLHLIGGPDYKAEGTSIALAMRF